MTAKDADMEAVLAEYKKELQEKTDEIAKMRESKKVFSDRSSNKNAVAENGKELMYAHMLGVMTKKGWDTPYAHQLFEKAGIDYIALAPDIDQEVSSQIEKEIQRELRIASLFREIPVNGAATILPIQPDTGMAEWNWAATYSAAGGNLENRTLSSGGAADNYQPRQVTLEPKRLVSTTFMDNEVDEQVLINIMPMLVEGVARAHARAVENALINGTSATQFDGMDALATAYDPGTFSLSAGTALTSAMLLGARSQMGKYGIRPEELAFVVSQNSYYDLLADDAFQRLDEVGSDLAARVTGALGAVYGTPLVVSDNPAAFCVYTRNYVMPRLRGVSVEQDYEVMNQRRVIVATQNLGFTELLTAAQSGSGNSPLIKIDFEA